MGARHNWTRLLAAATACAVLASPAAAGQNVNASARPVADRWDARVSPVQGRRDDRRPGGLRGYQEQAFARGYSDGFRRGQDDGHDRDRYDPVRQRDYREGDQGYSRSYGSKDAYRNNYRAGFRQGYEDGYRDGNRGRYRDNRRDGWRRNY
jgi:hypothetical protein